MKISVVIPVYNLEKYLGECLDSLIVQDFRDWEAVCVDDGSADASAGIMDAYAKRDGRIRVVKKGNGGVSSARNRGLEEAKGEYVWFVDGDDIVPQGALGEIARALDEARGPDFLMIRYSTFKDGGVAKGMTGGKKPEEFDLSSGDIGRFAFFARSLVACNGIFRREKYGSQRFRVYRNGEDSLWGFEALAGAGRVAFLDEELYAYRNRRGSARNTVDATQLANYFEVAGETIRIARERGLPEAYVKETERLAEALARGTCAWVAAQLGNGTRLWREGAERLLGRKIEESDARLYWRVVFPGWLKFTVLHLPGMMALWCRVKKLAGRG